MCSNGSDSMPPSVADQRACSTICKPAALTASTIDVYFDSVGGAVLDASLRPMNERAASSLWLPVGV
jgi:NADPH-dependent curcumin reductase CurA